MESLFTSRDPFTGNIKETFSVLNEKQLEERIASAHESFATWNNLDLNARAAIIVSVGKVLLENRTHFAQIIHEEMGKSLSEAQAEIEKCAALCTYSAEQAKVVLERDHNRSLEGSIVTLEYQPLGVILAVMPWNFPFWQFFRAAVPILLSGNIVLLKHAMNTPLCALALEEIFAEVISSCAIVQSLFIDHDQIARVIADKRLKGVTLTGSKRAGVAVAIEAAKAIKPCTLELGGSDPFIVFADADLDEAVRVGVNSRCLNNGQSCISAKRFLIEQSIFERFAHLMAQQMSARQLGPQATLQQQKTLDEQVGDAISKGVLVHCGATLSKGSGYYYPPTVLSKVTPDMRVYTEEVFGPVATLFCFKDDDEALQIANDTEFGLAATLFTKDVPRIRRFSRELECGQVFVNEMVRSDPRVPFGGIKESGFGRELGPNASLGFTNEKVVWVKDGL